MTNSDTESDAMTRAAQASGEAIAKTACDVEHDRRAGQPVQPSADSRGTPNQTILTRDIQAP